MPEQAGLVPRTETPRDHKTPLSSSSLLPALGKETPGGAVGGGGLWGGFGGRQAPTEAQKEA